MLTVPVTLEIEPDLTVSHLLREWGDGRCDYVIAVLALDHPGLTAFFLTEGIKREELCLEDVNKIVNALVDKRVKLVQAHE